MWNRSISLSYMLNSPSKCFLKCSRSKIYANRPKTSNSRSATSGRPWPQSASKTSSIGWRRGRDRRCVAWMSLLRLTRKLCQVNCSQSSVSPSSPQLTASRFRLMQRVFLSRRLWGQKLTSCQSYSTLPSRVSTMENLNT